MKKAFIAFSMLTLLVTACVAGEEDLPESELELSQATLAAPLTAAPITAQGVCEDQLAFCEGRCVMGPPAFRPICFQRCYVGYQDCIGR